MTTTHINDVKAFHDKFGLETPAQFAFLPGDLHTFRTGFFEEEFKEYVDACTTGDLETAVDSLVDIIYITAGAALLHGIQSDEFYDKVDNVLPPSLLMMVGTNFEVPLFPSFLPENQLAEFKATIQKAIHVYNEAHVMQDELSTRQALCSLYRATMTCAMLMGISTACWQELWDDVQRANMSKVRALKASDSKRGSQWDVVKPAGWVPPDGASILKNYGAVL